MNLHSSECSAYKTGNVSIYAGPHGAAAIGSLLWRVGGEFDLIVKDAECNETPSTELHVEGIVIQ